MSEPESSNDFTIDHILLSQNTFSDAIPTQTTLFVASSRENPVLEKPN